MARIAPLALVHDLRAALGASGLSGREIHRRSGVHKDTVSRFLRREINITIYTASALCAMLGMRLTATGRESDSVSRAGVEVDVTDCGADSVELCGHISLSSMMIVTGQCYEGVAPEAIITIACHECGVEHLVNYFKE
jgi:transcriptional regulator with XRE-family HTH domain